MATPSVYTTPNQLITELNYRTGSSRTGVTTRWLTAELQDAVQQAIAIAHPLGRKRMLQMSGSNYLITGQPLSPILTYVPEVISIEKVMIRSATGSPSHVPTDLYYLDRYNPTQWLWLFNTPATTDTVLIYCVEYQDPLVALANPTVPVYLDAEMLLAYAMSELYRSWVDYGQTSSRENENMWSDEWRIIGDARRQQMMSIQYPQVQPPPASHSSTPSHSTSKAHR